MLNPINTFENILPNWHWGSGRSEQACAAVLIKSGAYNVTPQAPHGGPDGGRDIRYDRPGTTGAAACYFPSGRVSFNDVKKKFSDDLKRLLTFNPSEITLFTGQPLTIDQRAKIEGLATVPIRLLDAHALVLHYDVFAPFIGEASPLTPQAQMQPRVQTQVQQNPDLQMVRKMFQATPFFSLPKALELAPTSFGAEILEIEGIRYLNQSGQLLINDFTLASLVQTWHALWEQLLSALSQSYHLIGGRLYHPNNENHQSATLREQSNEFRNRMHMQAKQAADAFLSAHADLTQYIRHNYSEALLS